jgi:hypothetical protein
MAAIASDIGFKDIPDWALVTDGILSFELPEPIYPEKGYEPPLE